MRAPAIFCSTTQSGACSKTLASFCLLQSRGEGMNLKTLHTIFSSFYFSNLQTTILCRHHHCRNCIQMTTLLNSKRRILITIYHAQEETPSDASISQVWEIHLLVDLLADDPLEVPIGDLGKSLVLVLAKGHVEVTSQCHPQRCLPQRLPLVPLQGGPYRCMHLAINSGRSLVS